MTLRFATKRRVDSAVCNKVRKRDSALWDKAGRGVVEKLVYTCLLSRKCEDAILNDFLGEWAYVSHLKSGFFGKYK
jgi:hypothetical protein